jgi:hypothetical protein
MADEGPQKVTRPFHCLAIAIALVTVLGSLERAVWRVNDFGERLFGVSQSEMRERGEAQLKNYYESTYHRTLHFVDSAHLTGVDMLDKPLEEIIGLLNYAYFGLVAVLVLMRGKVKRHQVVHAYIYMISAAMVASAVFNGLGLAVFSVGAEAGSLGVVGLSGLGQLLGYLLVIYLVAIRPIVVLPRVLDLSGPRVALATGIATLVWLVSRFLFFTVLQWQVGIIWR